MGTSREGGTRGDEVKTCNHEFPSYLFLWRPGAGGVVNFATREAANTVASLDRFDWGGQLRPKGMGGG